MHEQLTDPDKWLNLGLPGAALLLVLVVILLIFNQQNRSITALCKKIDYLVTNFSDNNNKLNEVLLANDKDQKELLRQLTEIVSEVKDMHNKIVRIDARLFDYVQKEEIHHETLQADSNKE